MDIGHLLINSHRFALQYAMMAALSDPCIAVEACATGRISPPRAPPAHPSRGGSRGGLDPHRYAQALPAPGEGGARAAAAVRHVRHRHVSASARQHAAAVQARPRDSGRQAHRPWKDGKVGHGRATDHCLRWVHRSRWKAWPAAAGARGRQTVRALRNHRHRDPDHFLHFLPLGRRRGRGSRRRAGVRARALLRLLVLAREEESTLLYVLSHTTPHTNLHINKSTKA
jgi:hypothetical protein